MDRAALRAELGAGAIVARQPAGQAVETGEEYPLGDIGLVQLVANLALEFGKAPQADLTTVPAQWYLLTTTDWTAAQTVAWYRRR